MKSPLKFVERGDTLGRHNVIKDKNMTIDQLNATPLTDAQIQHLQTQADAHQQMFSDATDANASATAQEEADALSNMDIAIHQDLRSCLFLGWNKDDSQFTAQSGYVSQSASVRMIDPATGVIAEVIGSVRLQSKGSAKLNTLTIGSSLKDWNFSLRTKRNAKDGDPKVAWLTYFAPNITTLGETLDNDTKQEAQAAPKVEASEVF